MTAPALETQLLALADPQRAAQLQRYFKTAPGEYGAGDRFLGLQLRDITALAKQHRGLPIVELEQLLDSEWHEVRTTALAIMHQEAKSKRLPAQRRRELFELYLRRHDRINNWDLVDLGCRYVVGAYLMDKPRDVLYRLAGSDSLWERRTAIVSTWYLIRAGQFDDALAISELLLHDREDLIHKATGWMLRSVGDLDRAVLLRFLDEHVHEMPRTMLRYAIEKLPPQDRAAWLARPRVKR